MQVVDLFEARECELLYQRGDVDPIRNDPHVAEPSGDTAQSPKVDFDDPVDAGSLDLYDDIEHPGLRGIQF
jgi:hypothetical protein